MAEGSELRAFEFDSNGQVRSSMELQNPPDTFAREFLAFENGTLFVAGYYTDKAQESLRGHSFVPLFDSSGRMVSNLRDALSSVDLRVVQKAPFQGGPTVGEDGNAYMVDARKILVLSPGGEVTRRIPFEKPSADLVVGGIYVSGNQAAIRVAKWTEKSVENSFLLLDLSSGKLVAWYVPGNGMGYAVAGFSRNQGFTFLANEQGKMKVVRAEVK